MKNRTEDHDDDLERFRRTFRSDVASKTVKPLSAYRTQWPGHEEAIAAEYVAWKQANATRAGYIGPYRIVSELGRGGQAVVYLCDDERLGRKVAVKVLLGLGGSTERTLTRFRREAEITSRLDHPGICALYETGIGQGGVPWIAMRYVEGQPLSTVLAATRRGGSEEPTLIVIDYENVEEPSTGGDRTPTTTTPSASRIGRRDMDELLVIIEKTARALHVAHESGIIHRDVKPGNIMVAKGGQPVVLDFGFACADEDGHPTMTRTGELLGTPAYMSPEQLTAQRVALDRRTDIWSLGVTLYECLTLQRPFDAPSREALYRQILTKEPEDVRRLNPAIPAELAILLQTAMDKDPDRRYATAEAFADDLQRVREKKPIVARPMSALLRGRRWAQRNPSVAAMTIAVFLLISTFAVVMFLKNSQLEAKTIEAEGNARAARRNEDIANHNAALAARSAAEATRNFAEARRLADLKKLAEAHADLDALWPLGQDLLPRIVRFRQTYSELFDRLPDHEATLTKLEADALPYSKEEREADHGASLAQLADLKRQAQDLEQNLDRLSGTDFDRAEARLESIESERADLEARVQQRKTWRFAGSNQDYLTWSHEVLSGLVRDLRALADPVNGALAQLAIREARSKDLVRETLTAAELSWRQCSARVLANPSYEGLQIVAQEGLIPLGPDADSTLEEFLHWSSHAPGHRIPPRDARGHLPPMDGETGIILVLLPGGTFTMGATQDPTDPNHDPEANPGEGPSHRVTLSAFFVGKYEVTRGQWVRLTGRPDPSFTLFETSAGLVKPADYTRLPVERVSWRDGNTSLTRAALALPSEACWEYACRAGTSTPWCFGTRPEDCDGYANVADESYHEALEIQAVGHVAGVDDGFAMTAPVGMFRANRFGLHDLHGNVWEWCSDLYGPYPSESTSDESPPAQGDGSGLRVGRGGSFNETPFFARSAARGRNEETMTSSTLGVRAARKIAP